MGWLIFKTSSRSAWRATSAARAATLLCLLGCAGPNPRFHIDRASTGDAAVADTEAIGGAGGVATGGSGGTSASSGDAGGAGGARMPDAANNGTPDDAPVSMLDLGAETSPGGTGIDLTTGLVGHWDLDTKKGLGITLDRSGHGHDGTLVALDPEKAWVAGKFGNALSCDGADGSYVRIDKSVDIDAIQSFTVAAWVKRGLASSTGMSILSRQTSGSAETFNLTCSNNHLALYLPFSAGKTYFVTSPSAAPLNEWVHIAATYDGKIARLYEQGKETARLDYSIKLPATTNPLVIGNNFNSTGPVQAFVGLIDEVLLYSVVLTPEAIALLASTLEALP